MFIVWPLLHSKVKNNLIPDVKLHGLKIHFTMFCQTEDDRGKGNSQGDEDVLCHDGVYLLCDLYGVIAGQEGG